MKTTMKRKEQFKPKLKRGLSITSHQIRSRLQNKTLTYANINDSEFVNDEELIAFQKMSRVEQQMDIRKSQAEIKAIQEGLDKEESAMKSKAEEARIEREINKRMKQIKPDGLNTKADNTK